MKDDGKLAIIIISTILLATMIATSAADVPLYHKRAANTLAAVLNYRQIQKENDQHGARLQ